MNKFITIYYFDVSTRSIDVACPLILRTRYALAYIHAEVQHAVVGQAASGDALPLSSQHGSSPQPASAAGVSVGEFPSIMVYTICNGLGVWWICCTP